VLTGFALSAVVFAQFFSQPVFAQTLPQQRTVAVPTNNIDVVAASAEILPAPEAVGFFHPVDELPPLAGLLAAAPTLRGTMRSDKVPSRYDLERIGQRGIGSGVNFYSLEKEQNLGRELARDVEAQSRIIGDPVITEYVNRVGQQLVRNSDARVPFVIKVVDNDEINAFALPGGFFYVNTGLLLAAENEAELAGVMAHEIAHVAARHATRNATKAEIWNIASLPLVFLGGPAGYAVRQIAGLAVPMGFLKFSRDAEREADLLGLEYCYKAGYDPASFVQFFEKLHATEKKKHSALAKAFATHPMTEDRIKRAQQEIERVLPPRNEYVVSTSEFDEVRARLEMLESRHRAADVNARPQLRRREKPDGQ
jgi:predicted Zn-dependent protease